MCGGHCSDGGPATTISIKGRMRPVECVPCLSQTLLSFLILDTSSAQNVTYYNTANIIIRELTKQVDLHVSCVYTLLLLTMGDALTKQ